jgi:hypothetical protein
MKMKTLFEEGFGVVGGAFGTKLGAMAGFGIVAILGLGPFGLFVVVLACATLAGIGGMKFGKRFGSELYEYYEPQFSEGKIYHSPEQFFWEAVQ